MSGPVYRLGQSAWKDGDGDRMTFNWMLDLYGRAMAADRITPEGHVQGIVLIDEIEQHLHPSMQAEILPRVTEAFPEIQLIATTHSPLVALECKARGAGGVRREGSEVVRERDVPDYTGYSAEDMLVDERLFDTEIYSREMRETVVAITSSPPFQRRRVVFAETRELRGLALEIRERPVPESRESEMVRQLKQLIEKHNR